MNGGCEPKCNKCGAEARKRQMQADRKTLGVLICRRPTWPLSDSWLNYRRLAPLLKQLRSLLGAILAAGAVVVRRGCLGCAMRDSSSVRGVPTGLDARPPGLMLAMYGHIKTFSKMPQRLYQLFDAPVDLGPFSSWCHRAAAFVTRMGIYVQIWSNLDLIIFKVL
ncbi:hypothetical protein CRG98_029783 [Punica granatum]|uniref:Uncharacterized protein n=1 Tax=Punica granatum TaxID=22663 RepID=A0A2I0J289_PUNGR|nr:hypothetical protein CRG98_029783 [Punica granatum]